MINRCVESGDMRYPHVATIDDLAMIGSWLCAEDRRELAVTRNPDDYESLAIDAWNSHMSFVFDDTAGRPVFAIGAYPVEPGVAIVWGFKTEAGWRLIKSVTKFIQKCMIPELRAMGVTRAVCLVHPDNKRSQKWLAHMGFQPVATHSVGLGTPLLVYQRDDKPHATLNPETDRRLH